MASALSQPAKSYTAGTTFATADLHKFVEFTTDAQVVVNASTNAARVVGTLLSVTATTAGAGVESVSVGSLIGRGKVYMAASTLAAGDAISASSAGFGVAPSTDGLHIGYIFDGSSGTTGRVHTVDFSPTYN